MRTFQDNRGAAIDLWLGIDDQVSELIDPNFPRRRGRVPGTLELLVHPNYVVILEQVGPGKLPSTLRRPYK